MATVDAWRRQIKVSPHLFHPFWKLILFQILKKKKESHKAQGMVIGGVSAGLFPESRTDLGFILQPEEGPSEGAEAGPS